MTIHLMNNGLVLEVEAAAGGGPTAAGDTPGNGPDEPETPGNGPEMPTPAPSDIRPKSEEVFASDWPTKLSISKSTSSEIPKITKRSIDNVHTLHSPSLTVDQTSLKRKYIGSASEKFL